MITLVVGVNVCVLVCVWLLQVFCQHGSWVRWRHASSTTWAAFTTTWRIRSVAASTSAVAFLSQSEFLTVNSGRAETETSNLNLAFNRFTFTAIQCGAMLKIDLRSSVVSANPVLNASFRYNSGKTTSWRIFREQTPWWEGSTFAMASTPVPCAVWSRLRNVPGRWRTSLARASVSTVLER